MDTFVLQYSLAFSNTWGFETGFTATWSRQLGKRKVLVDMLFTKALFKGHIVHTNKDGT